VSRLRQSVNVVGDRMAQVWSCGGGRQSCAIAVLIVEGKYPKPDISVIANTGRERFSTFPYLTRYVIPALASVGVELTVIDSAKWSYHGIGYVDGSGDLMLPAYGFDDKGEPTKYNADCSGSWKRDAINRWLSNVHGITRSQYVKWIGFSRSPKELFRAHRMSHSQKEGGEKTRFPLIELGLSTGDCMRIIERYGWPAPKVSACWMCPNLKDSERADLSDEEKRLALAFDAEVRSQFPNTYLHGSYQPLDSVDLSKPQDLFTETCDSGNCFV
jgi:hypothetical protein